MASRNAGAAALFAASYYKVEVVGRLGSGAYGDVKCIMVTDTKRQVVAKVAEKTFIHRDPEHAVLSAIHELLGVVAPASLIKTSSIRCKSSFFLPCFNLGALSSYADQIKLALKDDSNILSACWFIHQVVLQVSDALCHLHTYNYDDSRVQYEFEVDKYMRSLEDSVACSGASAGDFASVERSERY